MKILKVDYCGDEEEHKRQCPFFKRTSHYDYNDVCKCKLKDWDVPQFKRDEIDEWLNYDKPSSLEPEEYDYIGGQIPDWCPLEDLEDE